MGGVGTPTPPSHRARNQFSAWVRQTASDRQRIAQQCRGLGGIPQQAAGSQVEGPPFPLISASNDRPLFWLEGHSLLVLAWFLCFFLFLLNVPILSGRGHAKNVGPAQKPKNSTKIHSPQTDHQRPPPSGEWLEVTGFFLKWKVTQWDGGGLETMVRPHPQFRR